jgi:hypothetical protein
MSRLIYTVILSLASFAAIATSCNEFPAGEKQRVAAAERSH